MDFELSEQQAAFRDLMRDFARKSISPVAREWELAGRYPEEIVEEMKAMGLFGMLVPEEYGGIAIDAVSYSVVFEEISKAWMGVAGILGSHSLATLMLARFGTPNSARGGCRTSPPASGARASRSPSRRRAATCRASLRWRGARAITTSSTAPRPGSPTRAMPTRCRCSSRPIPMRSPAIGA